MIRLRLLGETAIDIDGTPVGPESQVIFAVLLLLSLERGKRIARTALHRLLWPAADDESGRHNLRQVAYKLRQLGVPLDATQSSLMLPSSTVEGELVELLAGTGAVGARLLAGRRVGELLPGYAPTFSSPFADWVDEQRGLLQSGLRRALLAAMAEARQSGRWREVEAIAREVLRFDPLNEEATLALAEATALAGSKAQAIDIIDRYLGEVGRHPGDLRLPANVLRRRIAERLPTSRYVNAADRCFVGRDADMAALLPLWYAAKDGRGGGALLWGDLGIGKSRLAFELTQIAALQGARVVRATSRSWDAERPLSAVVDLVPTVRELPGAAGIDPQYNDYLDRLTKHDPSRPLMEVSDLATLHRLVRQAVFELVDAVQSEQPLVLLLEDVQWLDPASWEVLAELLRLARRQRLMIVMTSRDSHPTGMPERDEWEVLHRHRVEGIDPAATNELLDAITREAGRYMDPDHRDWCVPLAGGNPLHVQEVALQWLEKGSIREAPATVRAMIGARIDCLSSIGRLALQITAVLGFDAELDFLTGTGLLSPRESIDAVRELTRAGLFHSNGKCTTIRHPVVADLVLGNLDEGTLRFIHRHIGEALERQSIRRADLAMAWESARHWMRSSCEHGALDALLRCARHMLAIGLPSDALRVYELASTLPPHDRSDPSIVCGRIEALAHDDRWLEILRVLADTHLLQVSSQTARSGSAALRMLEARWRTGESLSPIVRDACQLAAFPVIDQSSRLEAAILATVISDNRDGRFEELDRIQTELNCLLDDPRVSAESKFRYRMIALGSRLQFKDSAEQARSLLKSLDSSARPLDTLPFRQAAYALRHAGFVDEAESALGIPLAELPAELTASQRDCCIALAQLRLYTSSWKSAGAWIERAGRGRSTEQNLTAQHSFAYVACQFAAANNDAAELQAIALAIGEPFSSPDNFRLTIAGLAAHIRAAVADDTLPRRDSSRLVAAALQLVRLYGHRGQMDFPVSAICRALIADAQESVAISLISWYLPRRSEQCRVHADLASLIHDRPNLLAPDARERFCPTLCTACRS